MTTKSQGGDVRHRRQVLALLSLAAFMASLDLFIVNVAFEDIARSFASSTSAVSWVLNGYAIVYAALLVPAGRLADRFGRKPAFLLGLALFTLASAGCAASPSLGLLVACRVLQAAGAAVLTPASLGLVLAAFPAAERAGAVRVWATTGALAAAAGPVVGGLLVEASWRWVFLVNLPIGLLALVGSAGLVADSRDPAVTRLPDLVGAGLLVVGIGALALGVVEGPDWGWGSARVLGALVVAVLATAAFARRSARHPLPVIEPALLAVRSFAWANLTALAFGAAFAGNLLWGVLWMQQVWGYSALQAGLGFALGPLMVPPFAAVAGRLRRRVGPGTVTALGCVLLAAGAVITLLRVGQDPAWAAEVLPGLLVGGAGVGLALPEILSASTADLPPERSATGSAVVNMSRQVGSVVGVSVLVAVLGAPAGYAAAHDAFQAGWLAIAGAALLGALLAPGMTPRTVAVVEPAPGQVPVSASVR